MNIRLTQDMDARMWVVEIVTDMLLGQAWQEIKTTKRFSSLVDAREYIALMTNRDVGIAFTEME